MQTRPRDGAGGQATGCGLGQVGVAGTASGALPLLLSTRRSAQLYLKQAHVNEEPGEEGIGVEGR